VSGAVILAGDVGGTSTRVGLFEIRSGQLAAARVEKYPSRGHEGLREIVHVFMATEARPVRQACFGIAGPVIDGRADTPNLPWVVEAADLARELGLPRAWLINDVEANTHGIAALQPSDLAVLSPGEPGATGNIAVISAGTGLGLAGAYWDGNRHHPFAGEGGHADFAPHDALQVELLLHLQRRLGGHVSWERVVSGPGLHGLYEFLRDSGRGIEPAWLRDAMARRDPSAIVSEAGLAGTSELCVRALDLFVRLYGSAAGNLALTLKATGGIYVGGGIAPRIVERLKDGLFLDAFLDKGRLRSMLERVPVRVILNDEAALLGAARYAALRAGLLDDSPLES
jgi:glucokinase